MALWNVFQEVEIQQLRADRNLSETSDAERAITVQERTFNAEDRFEKLLLVTAAMWELVSEKAGITDAELAARIIAIDERDGHRDGRRITPARRCSQCDAAVAKDRATCMFCGHAEPGTGVFDDV